MHFGPSLALRTIVFVLLVFSMNARAQFGAHARVERPIAATTSEDPTSSASVVDAEDRSRGLEGLADLLLEVPGSDVARTGAWGSSSELSLRGAGSEHTVVFLDSIPLGSNGAAFDLSTVPVGWLSRVEVYRSVAPAWLLGSAIGGVVNLVSHDATRTGAQVEASLGSFDLVGARVASHVHADDTAFFSTAGFAHSDGDFTYNDDRGTPFVSSDDLTRRRSNSNVDEGDALFSLSESDVLGGELHVLSGFFERTGGLPGPASAPSSFAHRTAIRYMGGASWEKERPNHSRLELATSFTFDRTRTSDPYREIGLAQREATDDLAHWTIRAAYLHQLPRGFALSAVLMTTSESRALDDAFSDLATSSSFRQLTTANIEARWHGKLFARQLEVRAHASVDSDIARLTETRAERAGQESSSNTFAPGWRVGVAYELAPGLAWSSAFGGAVRLPSTLELFGDNAFVLGDTRLDPERGRALDTSLVWNDHFGPVRVLSELRGFYLFMNDLIRYRRTSQYTVVPENVASASIRGLEFAASIEVPHATALTSWTLQLSDDHGRDLPLRERYTGYSRVEGYVGPWGFADQVGVCFDVSYAGESFADPENTSRIPARTTLGAGIFTRLFKERATASFTLANLTGVQGSDVLGFPLPGRTFMFSLQMKTDSK